jgi:hypothetical protein
VFYTFKKLFFSLSNKFNEMAREILFIAFELYLLSKRKRGRGKEIERERDQNL